MRNVFVTILTLFFGISSFAQSNISALEYFIDNDPGVGSGIPLPITLSANVDEVSSIPSSSMTQGFHTVGFRVQDVTGAWSMTSFRPVYVASQRVTTIENIADIEYFIDNDPGFGNGTPAAFSPGTDIDLVESIPTSALTQGFHTLSIRSRDALGNWSVLNTVPFYMASASVTNISDINNIEYFIDNDPGVGNGTPVLSTVGPTVDLIESIPTTALTEGFHQVTIRIQDINGEWSLLDTKPFYVMAADVTTPAAIARFEYYIDNDPGVGNATSIDVTDAVTVDLLTTIDPSGLSKGFHQIGYRVLSTDSVWSMQEVRHLYYDGSSINKDISAVEYFFDVDPGFGNGTEILLTPGQDIDTVVSILTSSLDTGNYYVGVRSRTADTTWGLTEFHSFRISNFDACQLDSLALVSMYDSLGGSGWNDATNWLSGPIATWSGVTLNGCRIDSLDLSNNGLNGELPDEVSNLTALTYLDLSNNDLQSLSDAILQDTSLQVLVLTNTGLSSLPNLDTLPHLHTIHLDSNSLDFGDLESISTISTIVADPQDLLSSDTTFTVTNGGPFTFGLNLQGDNNTMLWYHNGTTTAYTTDSISLNPITLQDSGTYYLEVTNSLVPNTTLYSGVFTIVIEDTNTVVTDTGSTATDPIAFYAFQDLLDLDSTCTDSLKVVITKDTDLGLIEIRNDSIIFTPIEGAIGFDTLSFIASNLCDTIQDEIILEVNNSDPYFTDVEDQFDVDLESQLAIELGNRVFDFNGNEDLSTLKIITQPTANNVSANITNNILTADYSSSNFVGIDRIEVEVCDFDSACRRAILEINVTFDIEPYRIVTPNGDGVNDVLFIKNIQKYPDNTVRIFTKWGDIVYSEEGYNNEDNVFTGNVQKEPGGESGNPLGSGTYYYVIELKTGDNDHCLDKKNVDFDCDGYFILLR